MLKLTYSNLEFQNFPGEYPRTPSSREGEGSEGKGMEGGRGRIGKGRGHGREGWRDGRNRGWWGGEGSGGAFDMGSAPPRDKLWIRPWNASVSQLFVVGQISHLECAKIQSAYSAPHTPS